MRCIHCRGRRGLVDGRASLDFKRLRGVVLRHDECRDEKTVLKALAVASNGEPAMAHALNLFHLVSNLELQYGAKSFNKKIAHPIKNRRSRLIQLVEVRTAARRYGGSPTLSRDSSQ